MKHSQNGFSFVKAIAKNFSLQHLFAVLNDLPYNMINHCRTGEKGRKLDMLVKIRYAFLYTKLSDINLA